MPPNRSRRKPRSGRDDQRRAHNLQRRTKALELRLKGVDFQRIADECGYYSKGAAHRDIQAAFAEIEADYAQTVEQARSAELARLDLLQTTAWRHVEASDPALALRAVETVLKISQQRSKLVGMDQPVRHDISMAAVEERITALKAFLAEATADDSSSAR